ncbi:hypothetical protein [Rhodococcus sp. NPDC060176]|uniref:hypothetical protein n=1 Tax=Rhodococcus sp. NPDC060176 TaxID=3347062 RepID=UPI00364D77FA
MSIRNFVNMDTIRSIRDTYDNTITQISSDTRLSPEGARIEKGRAYVEATAKMDALKDQYRHAVKTKQRALEAKLYGPGANDPASIIAFRDAVDRASKIGSDVEAKRAWDTAQWSNDTGMQRAIAQKANRMGWTETYSAHTSEYPGTAELFSELRSLPDAGDKDISGPAAEVATFRVSRPTGFGMASVDRIASEVAKSDAGEDTATDDRGPSIF